MVGIHRGSRLSNSVPSLDFNGCPKSVVPISAHHNGRLPFGTNTPELTMFSFNALQEIRT